MHSSNLTQAVLSLLLVSIAFSAFTSSSVKPFPEASATTQNTVLNLKDKESKAVKVTERPITESEIEKLKHIVGTYNDGESYCLKVGSHGTGLRPPTEKSWSSITREGKIVENILQVNSVSITSPPAVDLSSSSWFPPIGNQDGEGSCVAWAVGYYVKTFQEAKEHGWNLSEAQWEGGYYGHPTPAYQSKIISPDFVYRLINGGVDEGSSFEDAINLVCGIGSCSWEKMPYNPSDHSSWPSEEAWREAPLYRGNSSGFEYLMLDTDEDLASLKNWIASENLAVIGVDADQYNTLFYNDLWTLDNYFSPVINHANTIVGYDDTFEYTEGGQTRHGAFKIANSWGVGGWENVADGYYWISYEAMKQRVEYCMFYGDRIDYKPELLSSFRINHSRRGECDILIGVGNHLFPATTKSFTDLVYGGNYPFCANNIVFDITEFKDDLPTVYNQTYFIRVYDGGSAYTGTLISFSVQNVSSEDTPVTTFNGAYVYADVFLSGTIRVPSQYATIQEAINAASPRMTIEVSSGIYHENVVMNKTVVLLGESQETTIIDGGGAGNSTIVTADDVTVRGFTVTNGINGLVLNHVRDCKISENKITNSHCGVILRGCSDNILSGNTIEGNEYNFGVEGSELSHFMNSVNASNTINGKPIHYLVNQKNYTIDSRSTPDIGYLAFVNSTNIIIQNVTVEDNYQGVLLAYTRDSLVQNVTVLNNIVGLELCNSSNNTIFHNNFINNQPQALTSKSYNNFWDEGYPKGGNYWDSYASVDEKSGPLQNLLGGDGIGDVPWVIDADNTDNYPLMSSAGADRIPPVTHDDYDGLWHAVGFVITLTATDVWSGVAETYYKINNGPTRTLSTNGQPHITVGGANNTLEYWSVDNVGNEELPHKLLTGIKSDDTAPTGSITINNGNPYTNSTSVTLTLTAIDTASGVSQVRYSNDGVWDTEPWETFSQTKVWSLTPDDGARTVYFQIRDNAGLSSQTYFDTTTLDRTAAMMETLTRAPAGDVQSSQSVTVSVNVTDAVSGVKNVTLHYSVDNSTSWTTLPMNHNDSTGFYEAVIPGQQSGTWVRYRVTAYDYAGNNAVFDQTGLYTVSSTVPGFPSIVVAVLFMILTTIVLIFVKKRAR